MTILLYEDMLHEPNNFYESFDNIFGVRSGYFQQAFKNNFHNAKGKSKFGTFTKDGRHFVPFFRDELLASIDDYFHSDNIGLSKYIDRKKLLQYGYIRS